MAQLTKRLCLPVGSYTKQGAEKPTIEYREIGHVIEFEDREGNKWSEVRLHIDALNPVLAGLAMRAGAKGESSARVKLFDIKRESKSPAAAKPQAEPDVPAADEDIPF